RSHPSRAWRALAFTRSMWIHPQPGPVSTGASSGRGAGSPGTIRTAQSRPSGRSGDVSRAIFATSPRIPPSRRSVQEVGDREGDRAVVPVAVHGAHAELEGPRAFQDRLGDVSASGGPSLSSLRQPPERLADEKSELGHLRLLVLVASHGDSQQR